MVTYILRRLLFFIPTLFVITLVAFWISVSSPIDPVENLTGPGEGQTIQGDNLAVAQQREETRTRVREKLNLHLPLFYVGLGSLAEPDTLYKFYDREVHTALSQLLSQSGNWDAVFSYYESVKSLLEIEKTAFQDIQKVPRSQRDLLEKTLYKGFSITKGLQAQGSKQVLTERFYQLDTLFSNKPFFAQLDSTLDNTKAAFDRISTEATTWKSYVPTLFFYGIDNQYHKWIWQIITEFNFGYSYENGQNISKRIGNLMYWSFLFAMTSSILAYLIAIPLGLLGATFPRSRFDKATTISVFALDSLPNFWVATLLLVTFANPDVLNWFPSSFNEMDAGFERFVLPLIAYTYGGIAFTSRVMRASMLEVIQQDYMRTAHAKGLKKWTVLLRHGARNALLPIITGFAGFFPSMLGGSVILETIFSIPGMGREIFNACFSKDIPMIMAVFTLMGFLTILGYLVSDILYTFADPRIRLHDNSKA